MSERPILFSTDMVQALLDGRKTQTRRVIKPQPTGEGLRINHDFTGMIWRERFQAQIQSLIQHKMWTYLCPYGKPGDILWVRESFRGPFESGYVYRATSNDSKETVIGFSGWKPSIHMPKKAARIWLKVTNIRVERLLAISPEEAVSEGINRIKREDLLNAYQLYPHPTSVFGTLDPKTSFFSLWDMINGPDSHLENPWVWVVEFEVISTTGNPG